MNSFAHGYSLLLLVAEDDVMKDSWSELLEQCTCYCKCQELCESSSSTGWCYCGCYLVPVDRCLY